MIGIVHLLIAIQGVVTLFVENLACKTRVVVKRGWNRGRYCGIEISRREIIVITTVVVTCTVCEITPSSFTTTMKLITTSSSICLTIVLDLTI